MLLDITVPLAQLIQNPVTPTIIAQHQQLQYLVLLAHIMEVFLPHNSLVVNNVSLDIIVLEMDRQKVLVSLEPIHLIWDKTNAYLV